MKIMKLKCCVANEVIHSVSKPIRYVYGHKISRLSQSQKYPGIGIENRVLTKHYYVAVYSK